MLWEQEAIHTRHYPVTLDPGQGHPFPGRTSPFPSILEISPPTAVPTRAQLPVSSRPCNVGHLSHSLYCWARTHSNPQRRVRRSQRKGDIPGSCPLPALWVGKGSSSTQTNCSLSQQSHLCSKKSLYCVLCKTPHRPLGMTSRPLTGHWADAVHVGKGQGIWTLGKAGQLGSEPCAQV